MRPVEPNLRLPKLYVELASWFPVLTPPSEYVEEAEFYRGALIDACDGPLRTVLELGSGGGNNASHLKAHFEMTLVDVSAAMLEVSRALNPECEHVQGDIRTARLGRQFDAVFVHDAVCYMTTESDLRQVMETAYAHCRPGGAALFAPDYIRETFRPSTDHGGSDQGLRSLRYLEWIWDPDPEDTTYLADYAYLIRDQDGAARVEYDRHVEGLFAGADWLRLFGSAGFVPVLVPSEDRQVEAVAGSVVFVCTRPNESPDS
jgi:SAM-dependent methyltransferase